MVTRNDEYDKKLIHLFSKTGLAADYIIMDGHSFTHHQFLRNCWNYAVEHAWLEVIEIHDSQETQLKGYLTDKGKKDLGL